MTGSDGMFEWDENKRRATIEKHGIDFLDLGSFFKGPCLVVPARSEAEPRLIAIGELRGDIIAVVFTIRDDRTRIITARKARGYERENFRALHAG